jgi:hypothetical protein
MPGAASAPPRPRPAPPAAPAGAVDFDLHGFVGVRLVGASARDAAAVEAQLGPIRAPLDREPDITIRFVDRLQTASPLRLLGSDDAAYDDEGLVLLRGRRNSRTRVRVPLDRAGGACTLVAERGLQAVPLLVAIVNLTALAKGVVPLHAAAFVHRGQGVLVTGWAKGGKTETLLAFMADGARYVGDEWVYLLPGGRRLCGIPEPVTLWDWHLDDLPAFRAAARPRDRAVMRAARAAIRADERRLPQAAPLRRLMPAVERRARVHVAPHELFGADACPGEGPFDRLLFVGSHTSPDVAIRRVDPDEVSRRMVFSLRYERLELLEAYSKLRFAFPARRNLLIEASEDIEREALGRAFAGKEAYEVLHPYPVAIPALRAAIGAVL